MLFFHKVLAKTFVSVKHLYFCIAKLKNSLINFEKKSYTSKMYINRAILIILVLMKIMICQSVSQNTTLDSLSNTKSFNNSSTTQDSISKDFSSSASIENMTKKNASSIKLSSSGINLQSTQGRDSLDNENKNDQTGINKNTHKTHVLKTDTVYQWILIVILIIILKISLFLGLSFYYRYHLYKYNRQIFDSKYLPERFFPRIQHIDNEIPLLEIH